MSRLGWAARLLVSIILVAWLLHNFSFAPVVDRMGGIRTGELVGILGLASAQFLMFGLRWWLVGMACAAELPLRSAVRIAFISMFFNQVLPATVGGDIVRTYLASREGVRIHRAIVGVMIDRIIGSVALVGLVIATLPAFHAIVSNSTLRVSLTTVAFAGALASGLLLLAGGRVAQFLKRRRVMRPVGILTEDLRGLLSRPSALPIAALSIAIHLASVGIVILLAAAMDIQLDPLAALALVLPVILIIMIPLSVAGWGVREGALVVALGQMGIAPPDALAISIAFGLACLAASLPGGMLWLWEGSFCGSMNRSFANRAVERDSMQGLHYYRHVWQTKPVLRAVYTYYYREIVAYSRAGRTLEVGGGSGNLKSYLADVITSDIQPMPWLDVVADAHRLPFAAECLDNIVLFDVLHHLQRPRLFLVEAERVLRVGGRLVIIEPAITPLSWLFYKTLHDEPIRMSEDPLADGGLDPMRDPSASNQAIPTLLFGRYRGKLARGFPRLRLIERRQVAYLAYPLSGGFKRWRLLPTWAVAPLLRLERWLEPVLQSVMAFRLLAVMEKV